MLTSDSASGIDILPSSLVLRLLVTPVPWADTIKTMTIEFGSSKSTLDYDLRPHSNLGKRQATLTVSSTPTISYPFDQIPTSATKAHDLNLNSQWINKDLAHFPATLPQSGNSSVS